MSNRFWVRLALAAASAVAGPAVQASVIILTGGDPGQGYAPLRSEVYAYHFVGPTGGSIDAIQNVSFLPVNVPNGGPETVVAGNATLSNVLHVYPGGAASLGASANDLALQDVMSQFAIGANHTSMALLLGGLVTGQSYQLDLFWQYPGDTVPASYVITDATGTTVENVPGVAGTFYDVQHRVVADSLGQVSVLMTNSPSDSNFPFLDAFSLTQVPEPSSLLLAGFGGLLLALRRRRRRA